MVSVHGYLAAGQHDGAFPPAPATLLCRRPPGEQGPCDRLRQDTRITRGPVTAPTFHPRRPQRIARRWLGAMAGALPVLARAHARNAEPRHAIAMHDEPALPEGFSAFRYVNPDAPKGGRLTEGIIGTFDSLNPLNI